MRLALIKAVLQFLSSICPNPCTEKDIIKLKRANKENLSAFLFCLLKIMYICGNNRDYSHYIINQILSV